MPTANHLYLASFKWPEQSRSPLLIGTNKAKVARAALKLAKEKWGTGPVNRGSAMCSVPIAADDIEIVEVATI